jgi:hypothetical protein
MPACPSRQRQPPLSGRAASTIAATASGGTVPRPLRDCRRLQRRRPENPLRPLRRRPAGVLHQAAHRGRGHRARSVCGKNTTGRWRRDWSGGLPQLASNSLSSTILEATLGNAFPRIARWLWLPAAAWGIAGILVGTVMCIISVLAVFNEHSNERARSPGNANGCAEPNAGVDRPCD